MGNLSPAHKNPLLHVVNAGFAPPPHVLHGVDGVMPLPLVPPSPPRSRIFPEQAAVVAAMTTNTPKEPRAIICMSMIVFVTRSRHGIDARLASTLGMNKLLGELARKRAARSRASS